MDQLSFWRGLDDIVTSHTLVIDRPAGTHHPRYPDFIYPYDYGYLEGTQAMDQGGIDVWVGSQRERGVTGIICTVDQVKQDAELKLLLGCTAAEAQAILKIHNDGPQAGLLIQRPT